MSSTQAPLPMKIDQHTAFFNACVDKDISEIERFIETIDVNDREDDGITFLHTAIMVGCEEAVKLILRKGMDPNSTEDGGFTPLHYAAMKGHENCLYFLLAYGADPNRKNIYGDYPLHYAYTRECSACVDHLLSFGADPTVKDDGGVIPEDCGTPQFIAEREKVYSTVLPQLLQ